MCLLLCDSILCMKKIIKYSDIIAVSPHTHWLCVLRVWCVCVLRVSLSVGYWFCFIFRCRRLLTLCCCCWLNDTFVYSSNNSMKYGFIVQCYWVRSFNQQNAAVAIRLTGWLCIWLCFLALFAWNAHNSNVHQAPNLANSYFLWSTQ